MGNSLVYYGIITDILEYSSSPGDVIWPFERLESDGSIKLYSGIETRSKLLGGVEIIGSSKDFRHWLYEHGKIASTI